jgi:SAM-dependent methyltransferase
MEDSVKNEIGEATWAHYYRDYQGRLARRYLIPVLDRWGFGPAGRAVLEVGCGDGGCAAEFHRAGARVVMMDIEERLVATAREANEREGIEAKVFVGDVYDREAGFYREGPFDLIMFRDVMEHLPDAAGALRIVAEHLTPGGALFVVFPPYYSAYGAHQQILPRKTLGPLPYNKLPFIQWLPDALFGRIVAGEDSQSREVVRLRSIRLTIARFERAAREAGLTTRARRFYLSRPSFALRYGIPVIDAGPLGGIPILREAVVTAAYYLLERKG